MDDTTEKLLLLARQGDRQAAETVLLSNSKLIWSVVRQFFGRGVDSEDLFQLGCIGFLKAVEGFQPSFGTQFSTYAVPKIAGEIRRFLRDDGTIKISRTVKEQAAKIRTSRSLLVQTLGREPTLGEISAKTGLGMEEIASCEAALFPPDSLQREMGEDGLLLEDRLCDLFQEENLIESIAIKEALKKLPEREQMVLQLRYYRGMTQQAVARILNISQVQVSRIEKRAIDGMRKKLS